MDSGMQTKAVVYVNLLTVEERVVTTGHVTTHISGSVLPVLIYY